MSINGHIRIFDAELVRSKAVELGCGLPEYWSYCNWNCSDKEALIVFWGDNVYFDPRYPNNEHDNDKQMILKKWANHNAVLVRDQKIF